MPEAGAAVVAAQLLAFYKEPVRYRPRLTLGREPFQGGLFVFRFAQGRFPNTLLRELSARERQRLREAAVFFIRQVCFWDAASHYQVLCVPSDARRETIKEHYHLLIALIHPDRRDASIEAWPAGAAQRVNLAYAILDSDEARREYDEGLVKSVPGAASLDEMPIHAFQPTGMRVSKNSKSRVFASSYRPMLVVTAVLATLFFFQVWWAADVPLEYAMLQSAAPFDLSSRWMRDVLSGDRPRFLAMGEAPVPRPASIDPEPQARPSGVVPQWRLSNRVSELRMLPASQAASAAPGATTPPPPPGGEPTVLERPRAEPVARAQPLVRPAVAAQSSVRDPAAQAPPLPGKASRVEDAISSAEMETLMALLVTYYEAGDLDRLLSLYDAASIGVWEALKLRNQFQEFFGSTRVRRLRLNKVSWETSGTLARARGEATLVVEYLDSPGQTERVIKLELEAVERNGVPRITRLNLFPYEG